MTYFENKYGVTFGFEIDPTGTQPARGIKGLAHTHRTFGLYPRSKPIITAPEVQSDGIIDVPGMDGGIDPTQALDGVVHYRMREIEAEYVYIGRREDWDAVYHELLAAVHGQKLDIILDEDPAGYYEGRFAVEEPEYDYKKGEMFLTITGTLQPFKWAFTDSSEDWLWDPFSFIDGVIESVWILNTTTNKYEEQSLSNIPVVSGTPLTVTIYAGHNSEVPDIILDSADNSVSVTYEDITGTSKTVSLKHGSNVDNTPDLLIRREPVELTFTGAGTLAIKHHRGVL